MLVNYFAQNHRSTPLNLAVSRVILGGCALWKIVSYDWSELAEWPRFLFQEHPHRYFLLSSNYLELVPWLEVILTIALLCFIIGYRMPLASFVSALLIAHIVSLQYVVTNHRTLLLVAQLILLYGLFSDEDRYSLDHYGREPSSNGEDGAGSGHRKYPMTFLKWALVTIALAYGLTGYGKIVHGPMFEWVSSDNLGRIIQMVGLHHLDGVTPMGAFIVNNPWLGAMSGWLTIVFESGFIVAVLFKKPVWVMMLGLFGMHTVVFLTHRLLFFDFYVLFLMFCPWDDIYSRLRTQVNHRHAEDIL